MTLQPVEKALGARIRAAREAAGLTQADLAGSEYSVAYVSRIESGERTPSPEALGVFAKRLGTSPAILLAPIDHRKLVELERLKVETGRAVLAADWEEARRSAKKLESMAGDEAPSFAAYARRELGEVEERLGDPEKGLETYKAARAIDSNPSPEDRIELEICMARAYRKLGDLGHAADLLERILSELEPEAAILPTLMARVCTQLVAVYFERGDYVRAREVALQGIEYGRAAKDTRTLANALWAAAPPMAVADPARALSLIRRAGTLYAELGLMMDLGRLSTTMGVIATQAGDEDAARAALDRAIELISGAGVTGPELARPLTQLAELELGQGRIDEALRLADQAGALSEGVDPIQFARTRRTRGQALAGSNPEAAERELRAAVELFISVGAQTEAARCFRSLGDLLVSQGRNDEALAIFREGLGAVEGAA